MLKALTELFDRSFRGRGGEEAPSREHAIQVATALLLIEVARADYYEDLAEDRAILELMRSFFELGDEELHLLLQQAKSQADHAVSLQEFTRKLHEELSNEEKLKVIEMLWRVAHADRHLDKHEDHLVRKIAGLLYVSHSDLIRIRNEVRASL